MIVNQFLVLGALLFSVGIYGVLVRRNALIMLMCVELMLCASNIVFAVYSRQHGDASGHVFVLMNFAVAAAEAAIGLAGIALFLLIELEKLIRARYRRTAD